MTFNLPRVEDTELFTWLRMLVEQIELGTMDDEKVRKITNAVTALADEMRSLREEIEALNTSLSTFSSHFIGLDGVDLNDIEATGMYYVSDAADNYPLTLRYMALMHIQDTAGEYKKQIAAPEGNNKLYVRAFDGSAWDQWTQIGG